MRGEPVLFQISNKHFTSTSCERILIRLVISAIRNKNALLQCVIRMLCNSKKDNITNENLAEKVIDHFLFNHFRIGRQHIPN